MVEKMTMGIEKNLAVPLPREHEPSLIEVIQEKLGHKYKNIQPFKEGGTGTLFLADWGPGNETRVIKVDKLELSNPRALRYVGRGYDTSHEIQSLAQLPNPERHNVMRILDYAEVGDKGILVMPHFESESLEERVQREPLPKKEFEDTFSKVLVAAKFLNQQGLVHRDLKPANILLGTGEREGEVRVTDLGNAGRIETLEEKVLPTAGSKSFTAPENMGTLTGEESKYTERTEIYSLGMNMYYALTGFDPFNYDPDERIALVSGTSMDLFDDDGKISEDKHNTVLEQALKKIPWRVRKYREIVGRCLRFSSQERYQSINELAKAFEEAVEPSSVDKFLAMSFWKKVVYVTAPLLTVGTLVAGGIQAFNQIQDLETKVEKASKTYPISSSWNGETLELGNNVLDLNVKLSSESKKYYPQDNGKYLSISPGEKFTVWISAKEKPLPKEITSNLPPYFFKGKVYIEGFPGKEFEITPRAFDPTKYYGDYGGDITGYCYEDLNVPSELTSGVYILAVELYTPEVEEYAKKHHKNKVLPFKFSQPGSMTFRKRIPLVVGEVKNAVYTNTLVFTWQNDLQVHCLDENKNRKELDKLSHEISIPELGYLKEVENKLTYSFSQSSLFNLPVLKKTREDLTLQAVIRDENENITHYSFLPLMGDKIPDVNYMFWSLNTPGQEFSEKLVGYRKELFKRSHDQSR